MDEKLIRRAAIKYRQWMVNTSELPPLTLQNIANDRLENILNKAGQMAKWSRRFFLGQRPRTTNGLLSPKVYSNIATNMIPNLGADIVHDINTAMETIRQADNNIVSPISLKEAIEEITVITEVWKDVSFKDNVLSVCVHDITLDDGNQEVDLGDFLIRLTLTEPTKGLSVRSLNRITSEGGYLHPHLSANRLCVGAGADLMKTALCQGRLEDYFRIIETILRTYNDQSPYEPLQEWYDSAHENSFYCETCEEWRPGEDGIWCRECETMYCEFCVEPGNGDCCGDCGEWMCGECVSSCSDCGIIICSNCIATCDHCNNNLCTECLKRCKTCDDGYCENCLSTCDHCNDNICDDCSIECNDCQVTICGDCKVECSECNTTICPNCIQKCCDGCGRKMCEICSKQNCSCLLTTETNA